MDLMMGNDSKSIFIYIYEDYDLIISLKSGQLCSLFWERIGRLG